MFWNIEFRETQPCFSFFFFFFSAVIGNLLLWFGKEAMSTLPLVIKEFRKNFELSASLLRNRRCFWVHLCSCGVCAKRQKDKDGTAEAGNEREDKEQQRETEWLRGSQRQKKTESQSNITSSFIRVCVHLGCATLTMHKLRDHISKMQYSMKSGWQGLNTSFTLQKEDTTREKFNRGQAALRAEGKGVIRSEAISLLSVSL